MREPIITREIATLPLRKDDAHKGEVGRIAIVGGCSGEVTMIGAPALVANAALSAGAGLVQMFLPEAITAQTLLMAPCATARRLDAHSSKILSGLSKFSADVLAIGPGLGDSLESPAVVELVAAFQHPVVIDADALILLSQAGDAEFNNPRRIVMTPHPGEATRLLARTNTDRTAELSRMPRRIVAQNLQAMYGCVVVLKGQGTIVTNGDRIYINETGNSGMATAGAGDVLTGIIAALIGQNMDPFEAAILGVYLHGLAGDFAAEELGRWSMTATDILDYLPEAFHEHATVQEE